MKNPFSHLWEFKKLGGIQSSDNKIKTIVKKSLAWIVQIKIFASILCS
jgi:hypothetical protein